MMFNTTPHKATQPKEAKTWWVVQFPLRFGLSSIVLMAVLCLVCFAELNAQQTNTGIKGTVTDSSGRVVVGATVTLQDVATGVATTATTNGAGLFLISSATLKVGEYSLKVSAPGFDSAQLSGIHLVSGSIANSDVQLAVGEVTQTIQVSTKAAQFDTTSSTLGTTTTEDEIKSLPLQLSGAPRSSLNFVTTMSAVNMPKTSDAAGGPIAGASLMGSGGNGSVNDVAGYVIDGMSAAARYFEQLGDQYSLPPDTVQEMRLASNFNAEQAWDGGVEISLTTKSGTDRFHGTAYEYFGNTVLDSKNWFAASASVEHQNEFGFNLGGPIRKKKIFFFGDADFYRYTNTAAGVVGTVPTPAMRTGDFSQLLGAKVGTDALGRPIYSGEIYDPSTTRTLANGTIVRDPFNCNGTLNAICQSSFSKVSSFFLAGYPAATYPLLTQQNWVGKKQRAPLSVDKFFVRIDQQYRDGKQTLMLGFDSTPVYNQINPPENDLGPLLTAIANAPYSFYRPRIAFAWTVKPNLLYSLNVAAAYIKSTFNAGNTASSTAGRDAGLTGVITPNLPVVNITNTTGFGYFYYTFKNPQFTFPIASTSMTWIKGKHTFKFGGDYIQSTIGLNPQTQYTNGSFTYSPLETGLPGYTSTGWGFASFLLGQVDNSLLNSQYSAHFAGAGFGIYGQDQWQVTPRLTINYGLRWDGVRPPWEHHDLFGAFSPTVPNPAAGGLLGSLQFWGTGRPGAIGLHYSVNPDYALFDPRLGIAFKATNKSVLRAYYGITDIPTFASFNNGTQAPTYGAQATATPSSTNNGVTPAFNWDHGFPGTVTGSTDPTFENGQAVRELLPNVNEVGRTQAFGMSFEYALPWGMTAKAEYVGKLTHGMFFNVSKIPAPSINQLPLKYLSLGSLLLANITSSQAVAAGITPPYPGFKGSVAQALLPYPQYQAITPLNDPGQFAEYNAGHFQLQKRFSNDLSFLVDYTRQKMFLANEFQEGMYRTQTKQLAPTDEPNTTAISYSYQLPFGSGKRLLGTSRGVVQEMVGGWGTSGILSYASGQVIAVTTQATIPSIQNIWPVLNPGVPVRTGTSCNATVPGSTARYLNINAFSTPAPYTLGNTNTVSSARDCSQKNENLSVFKTFDLSEGLKFTFNANFFNAFNRHTFGGLGVNINTSTFGTFASASTPRLIQFSGRLTF